MIIRNVTLQRSRDVGWGGIPLLLPHYLSKIHREEEIEEEIYALKLLVF